MSWGDCSRDKGGLGRLMSIKIGWRCGSGLMEWWLGTVSQQHDKSCQCDIGAGAYSHFIHLCWE